MHVFPSQHFFRRGPWRNPAAIVSICFVAVIVFAAPAQALKPPSRDPAEQLRFAQGLLERGFYEMAEEEFRRFMDHYEGKKQAPSAQFGLIRALYEQEANAECMSAINRFQKRWPSHDLAPKLSLWKGELLLKMGKLQPAAQTLKQVSLYPDKHLKEAAVYYLAQCYARMGRREKALDTYRRIAGKKLGEKYEYRQYALYALARLARQDGNTDTAMAAYKRLKQSEHVKDSLRQEGVYRLAELYLENDKYEKAINNYELLLVEYPDSDFVKHARKRRAWAYYELGNYKKAAELAKEWKEKYADKFNYEIEYILATSMAAIGKDKEALPYLQRLAQASKPPDEYRRLAWYHRIHSLLRMEKYEETVAAADAFGKAYPQSSELADAYHFAGRALYQLKKYEKAVTYLEKAEKKAGKSWEFSTDNALWLARCYADHSKFSTAAQIYRRLAGNKGIGNSAQMLLHAGRCEREGGNWEQAVGDFRTILEKYPKAGRPSRIAAKLLGETYAAHNQFDRAEEVVRELIKQETEGKSRARLRFFLGYVYYRQEKHEKAASLLRSILENKDAPPAIGLNARYFLTGSLLAQDKEDEALDAFANVLNMPTDKWPDFSPDLYFELERLYFKRHSYDLSEKLCRYLMARDDEQTKYRASLRLTDSMLRQGDLAKAKTRLENMLRRHEKLQAQGEPIVATAIPEISALLGKVYLKTGKTEEALHAFQTTLRAKGVRRRYKTIANWGMAHVLNKKGDKKQALDYTANAYVLGNDPFYVPRSMLLAVKIYLSLDQRDKARKVWNELRGRFPAFAAQQKDKPIFKDVVTSSGEASDGDSD